jgi:HSP20 family protein
MALPVRRRQTPARPRNAGRWEPFGELEELQQATSQLLERVLSGAGIPDGTFFTPPVDIEETDDAWIIEAELPGVSRKDINVEMRDDGELAIHGEVKERERKGILRRRTRPVGRFEFRVVLPGGVDAKDLDAKVEDGVLTVRVPKPESARARRIEVQSGDRNGG